MKKRESRGEEKRREYRFFAGFVFLAGLLCTAICDIKEK
jgi:hypothetical protein